MMGFLTASGSLARTVGPIFVSLIYNAFGPRVTFVAMCGMTFLTVIFIALVFKRLVPFSFEKGIEPPNSVKWKWKSLYLYILTISFSGKIISTYSGGSRNFRTGRRGILFEVWKLFLCPFTHTPCFCNENRE